MIVFMILFYNLNVNIVMFIKEFKKQTQHIRTSKTGKEHTYIRKQTICVFRCDNCDAEFERERGSMDPKRLSNNYFHVCKNCNAKVFAQKKGVERKQVWNLHASSNIPIGKL
jgi:DNA-directed RNA polymerase subunit RPC12/RpoP